jgi:hypothetical protein
LKCPKVGKSDRRPLQCQSMSGVQPLMMAAMSR